MTELTLARARRPVKDPSRPQGLRQMQPAGTLAYGVELAPQRLWLPNGRLLALGVREPIRPYAPGAFDAAACLALFHAALGDDVVAGAHRRAWIREAAFAVATVAAARIAHGAQPREAVTAVRRALLPRLFRRVGLIRAELLIDRIVEAAALAPRSG